MEVLDILNTCHLKYLLDCQLHRFCLPSKKKHVIHDKSIHSDLYDNALPGDDATYRERIFPSPPMAITLDIGTK